MHTQLPIGLLDEANDFSHRRAACRSFQPELAVANRNETTLALGIRARRIEHHQLLVQLNDSKVAVNAAIGIGKAAPSRIPGD